MLAQNTCNGAVKVRTQRPGNCVHSTVEHSSSIEFLTAMC